MYFLCYQLVGVPFFLLLCLSVTVLHILFRVTRAKSKVMVKLRLYHSLDTQKNRMFHFAQCNKYADIKIQTGKCTITPEGRKGEHLCFDEV